MKKLFLRTIVLVVAVGVCLTGCPALNSIEDPAREAAEAFKADHAGVLAKTIDDITSADESAVNTALAAYDTLGTDAKALLGDQKTLLDSLKTKIDELKAQEAAAAFKVAHAGVLGKSTGTVGGTDRIAVNNALAAYNTLSTGAKALLGAEKTLLDNLKAKIDELMAPADAAGFGEGHAAVLAKTTNTVTGADRTAVNDALAAYDALSDNAKALLNDEKALLDNLKAKIDELKAPEDADSFKTAHSTVLTKTTTGVTTGDETAVNAALAAYNDLSDDAKALLGDEKALLDNLKAKIDELKGGTSGNPAREAANTFRTNHATVLAKTTTTVATADENAVNAALTAYNGLSADAKALLGDEKALLDNLKAKIDELKGSSGESSFVAVTNITGVPDSGRAGAPVSLAGAAVYPSNATYNTISWVVDNAGGTGVTDAMVAAGSFTAASAGRLILTARVASGAAEGTPYTRNFTIDIQPPFVAVSGISPATLNAVTGTQLALASLVTVAPSNASYKDIEWSVKSQGATGLTANIVESGVFTPANAGTATLTATIKNGKAEGEDFTKDITLTIIKPVTGINNVPTTGTRGYPVSLAGAEAVPADATYSAISWSVKTPGAGVTSISGNSFTPSATGTVILTATITNGSAIGTDFTQDYPITITAPGEKPVDVGLGADTSITLRDKSGTTLSKNTTISVNRNDSYYVSINGTGYTEVVWYLNGTKQTVTSAMLYLDTSAARTIKLSVEGKKGGVLESSGTYTFTIN
jgi:hypothetical protein